MLCAPRQIEKSRRGLRPPRYVPLIQPLNRAQILTVWGLFARSQMLKWDFTTSCCTNHHQSVTQSKIIDTSLFHAVDPKPTAVNIQKKNFHRSPQFRRMSSTQASSVPSTANVFDSLASNLPHDVASLSAGERATHPPIEKPLRACHHTFQWINSNEQKQQPRPFSVSQSHLDML